MAQNELQPSNKQPQPLPHLPPDLAGLQGQLAALAAPLHPLAAAWQTLGTAERLPGWVCVRACREPSSVRIAGDAGWCCAWKPAEACWVKVVLQLLDVGFVELTLHQQAGWADQNETEAVYA